MAEQSIENLLNELFTAVKEDARCPYVQRDESGVPYCANGITEGVSIPERRYLVCDHASLQLFCLDDKRYDKCLFYNQPESFA